VGVLVAVIIAVGQRVTDGSAVGVDVVSTSMDFVVAEAFEAGAGWVFLPQPMVENNSSKASRLPIMRTQTRKDDLFLELLIALAFP
jgi:hypothetical protein